MIFYKGKQITAGSIDDKTISDTSTFSSEQINKLTAGQFGNGSATVDNDTGIIAVSLSNFPDVNTLQEGARFRVVFTNSATMETSDTASYTMTINSGTAAPVTVGNVAAGIGAFQEDKSYEFVYTGASFDCLSSTIIEKGTNSNGTWIKYVSGKIKMYGTVNITSSDQIVTLPISLKSTSLNDTIFNLNTDAPRMYRVQIVNSTSIKIYLETWEGVFWQSNSRWCLEQE